MKYKDKQESFFIAGITFFAIFGLIIWFVIFAFVGKLILKLLKIC